MSIANNALKYDEFLTEMLVNEKSILGFLSTIFNFLARRTDFYYVPQDPHENMGFPPGVAEELVIKVLRTCDPNNRRGLHVQEPEEINNEIMCSTVAQEVEVEAEEDENIEEHSISTEHNYSASMGDGSSVDQSKDNAAKTSSSSTEGPPVIPTQRNSETYNGAEREKYSWAQTIMDLDVTVKLPPSIKSSKDLKVTINPGAICVQCHNGDVLLKDTLAYKIKAIDSFWSIKKAQERWWTKLLTNEENIDLSKIDCSRKMDELPDDHIAKIRELQWNQEQKMKGLPTSDQIRNIEILKKAWNAEGSPFKGKEFDPNIFQHN
ncbi:CS domain-containing protein [Phthorimaea operculella]|nr:CS domain-containing protein [Phthorimaea operculella]